MQGLLLAEHPLFFSPTPNTPPEVHLCMLFMGDLLNMPPVCAC